MHDVVSSYKATYFALARKSMTVGRKRDIFRAETFSTSFVPRLHHREDSNSEMHTPATHDQILY